MLQLRTLVSWLVVAFAPSLMAQPVEPSTPPSQIPKIRKAKSVLICVNCEKPYFSGPTHNGILDGLASNVYVDQFRRALYLQDTIHQFESKAHFDNCDFDAATGYIDNLLADVDGYVASAGLAKNEGDLAARESAARKAFFSLGQALHGVQDFYAHTNYVELSVGKVKNASEIPIVAPWRLEGKDRIRELRTTGLVSGYVSWGFPKLCPSGTLSHGELAKDKASTKSGSIPIAHLQNLTQYQIAVLLAKQASRAFIDDAFIRWPLLKEMNGNHFVIDILVDRRNF